MGLGWEQVSIAFTHQSNACTTAVVQTLCGLLSPKEAPQRDFSSPFYEEQMHCGSQLLSNSVVTWVVPGFSKGWIASVTVGGKKCEVFQQKKILCEYNIFHAFFQLLKINGIRKTGWKFCPYFLFFPQKIYRILECNTPWESLLRAAVRAHLYKTKYIF